MRTLEPRQVGLAAAAALAVCLLSPAASAQCPRGQEMNADTGGRCCWPGQAWSKSRAACIGIPVCPPGYLVQGESCHREPCPQGQSITEDTLDHCCWPGQAWSNAKSRCVGVPQSCPNGRPVLGEDCAPVACEQGQVRMKEGACCWPGQTWWAERAVCVGTPNRCPAGTTAKPEGCISTGWTGFDGAAPEAGSEPAASSAPAAEPGPETWVPPPLLTVETSQQTPPTPVTAPVPVGSEPPPPPVEEQPKGPKKSRTTLALGLLLNDGVAGALAIRISPRLFSLLKDTPFKGTGVLLIEPWVWVGGEADRAVGWFRTGLALNLGAGWEQTLGPFEATVRAGIFNGFTFRTIVDESAKAIGFNYELKAVLGLSLAVPAGEGAKFVLGFDAYLGGTPLFLLSVGVTF